MAVTPVPCGDAILIFPLALILSWLTSSPPWLYQHLQDLLDLIRPVLAGGSSLVPGPALIVPSICLYDRGDNQGGGGVPPCLLQSLLGFNKMVGEIPAQPDLALFIPRRSHHTGQIQSGSFCQLQCS